MLLPIHIQEAKQIKELLESIRKNPIDNSEFDKINIIANKISNIIEDDTINDTKKAFMAESKKKELDKAIINTEQKKVEVMDRLENLYKSMEMFYPKEKMVLVIEELKKIL